MRLLRAWIAVGLLGSTACRSTLEAVRSPEEPGQALARFEGTLGLPERELRRAAAADLEDLALSVTEEARPDPAHADDAAFAVEAALRAAGFPDAVCTFRLDPAAGVVTLSVEAGPRCVLEEVELLGEPQLLSRSQLALLFEGPRLGLLGRGEPVFVETRVRSAPRAIVREYRARARPRSRARGRGRWHRRCPRRARGADRGRVAPPGPPRADHRRRRWSARPGPPAAAPCAGRAAPGPR